MQPRTFLPSLSALGARPRPTGTPRAGDSRGGARSLAPRAARWARYATVGLLVGGSFAAAAPPPAQTSPGAAPPYGWLSWRGPEQRGVTRETGLPGDRATFAKPLFTAPVPGRGAPVVDGKTLYVEGMRGEDPERQEVLVALDAETGAERWSHGENDFLSDTVYTRYGIGAPTVNPVTGDVYAMTANGVFTAYERGGRIRWQRSLLEELGRLTFPNSRTGAAIVEGDTVIVRGITANWGAQGAPRDRLYAFDTQTGALVWASTPGEAPKDNSFATPIVVEAGGVRQLLTGTGCGHVVALSPRTGAPLWRLLISGGGGVNASVVSDGERVYAVHGVENGDQSTTGRLVAIDLAKATERWKAGRATKPGEPVTLDRSVEAWRNDEVSSFSSSPILDGGRLYLTNDTGELLAIEAKTGRVLWRKKLARDQIHASPLLGDGKLYVPMNDGHFFVLRPSDTGAEVLADVPLEGACLGAPAAWNGRIYVQTTTKLYAFGRRGDNAGRLKPTPLPTPASPGASAPLAVELQARPSEVAMLAGERVPVEVRALDANGVSTGVVHPAWHKFVPATAKVRAFLDAEFDAEGALVAAPTAQASAGAFEAESGGVKGVLRGRVVPRLPYQEDFEGPALSEAHPTEKGVKFAYPPLPWIGGRFAWEVREAPPVPGHNAVAAVAAVAQPSATGASNAAPGAASTGVQNKALAKTLDLPIRQRAQTFVGLSTMHDYTVSADLMSEGNRRLMSDVGLIDQRYLVTLKGTWQQLEVSSNQERMRVAVPFAWKPGRWYRLLTRVDVDAAGVATVRAKAWESGTPEPTAWTIEVKHQHGHKQGAPGLYGFAPDTRFRVFVDNLEVRPNAP